MARGQFPVFTDRRAKVPPQRIDISQTPPGVAVGGIEPDRIREIPQRLVEIPFPLVQGAEFVPDPAGAFLGQYGILIGGNGLALLPGGQPGVAQLLTDARRFRLFHQLGPVFGCRQRRVPRIHMSCRLPHVVVWVDAALDPGKQIFPVSLLRLAHQFQQLGQPEMDVAVFRVGCCCLTQVDRRLFVQLFLLIDAGQFQMRSHVAGLQTERLQQRRAGLGQVPKPRMASGHCDLQGGVVRQERQRLAEMMQRQGVQFPFQENLGQGARIMWIGLQFHRLEQCNGRFLTCPAL